MKSRKTELMLFNVFLCLVVVFVHLLAQPLQRLTFDTLLYVPYNAVWRMATFVVQAFIFVSAVKTFLNGRSESYGKFMLKRIRNILLPYLIAVFLYYLYFVYIMEYFPFSIKDYLVYVVNGELAAHFYFIVVIMQFYLLYPLWKIILNKVKPVPAIGVAAVLTAVLGLYSPYIIDRISAGYIFPYTDRLFTTYLLYWVGGMYAGKYYDRFVSALRGKSIIYVCVFIIAAAADVKMIIMSKQGFVPPVHLDMIHCVYCISAILLLIKLCCGFSSVMRGPLKAIDSSSYYIYLYHVLFVFILDNNVLKNVNIGSVTVSFLFRAVVIYAACIALAYLVKLIHLPKDKKRGLSV